MTSDAGALSLISQSSAFGTAARTAASTINLAGAPLTGPASCKNLISSLAAETAASILAVRSPITLPSAAFDGGVTDVLALHFPTYRATG